MNYNGDGIDDLLLTSSNTGNPLILHGRNDGAPEVVMTLDGLGFSGSLRIVISDTNGDGRDDLKIYDGDRFVQVLLADEGGLFYVPSIDNSSGGLFDPENRIASAEQTIEITWAEFGAAIKAGNIEKAKTYVTSSYSTKLESLYWFLGEEVGEVFDQVESIAPYILNSDIAIYLVLKTADDGTKNIHTLTMVPQIDGSWKIKEM